ncbi:hypothetical protein CCACVL1_06266 [Corchorus capsularis]|uniref:Uncharacterized protein n=1 Tax=Corchorus capsularis TaxID=210143 RepID=A0A1R3JGF0_COCAP|nr:hypothetical protein CCACVL1_06266 [Corchorus capsularis]
MPSGSKKRKAAKKKKEQASNNNINSSTNNSPHGNDDPRSQDERDSDGGDVASPASQDDGHNHQNPFSKGEEEGKTAPSPVQSYVTEDKPVEQVTRDAESTEKVGLDSVVDVKIDKELESKGDLEISDVKILHVVHDKSSSSSSSSSSNSSSSDDESPASEKKSKEEAEEAVKVADDKILGGGDSISAVETADADNLVKIELSVPEKVDQAADIYVNKPVVSDVVDSEMKECQEKSLPPSNGVSGVELEENGGNILPSSGAPTAERSNVVETTQDSGSPEYTEKQPLVASTPPVVQRTSVFNCCGLFDVFTGSGR